MTTCSGWNTTATRCTGELKEIIRGRCSYELSLSHRRCHHHVDAVREHGEQFARERRQKKIDGASGLSSLLSLLDLSSTSRGGGQFSRSVVHGSGGDDMKGLMTPINEC